MAGRIKRPCAGLCGAVVSAGYCDACSARVGKKRSDRDRGSSAQRGYGYRWQKASAAWLEKHPWCADPYKAHAVEEPATCVDHKIPHRGDKRLFWDSKNWQSLCDSCHGTKTAKEDGGFGHRAAEAKAAT